MVDRHGDQDVPVEPGHARRLVDVTDLSPREIRARLADLENGHEARVEQAREELLRSLERLHEHLAALAARAVGRARAAGPAVAGAVAVGVTAVLLVRVAGRRGPGAQAAGPSPSRTAIRAKPSRFSPSQRRGSAAAGSSSARPTPHTRSSGDASTRTASPVERR